MTKEDIAIIKYHDNGQISEVIIRNQETDLKKKQSLYNRRGILIEQRDYIYFPDEPELVQITHSQYGTVSGGLQLHRVHLNKEGCFPFHSQTLKERWYHQPKKSTEYEYKYYEPTKEEFAKIKERKKIEYSKDCGEPKIRIHEKFDLKGNEV